MKKAIVLLGILVLYSCNQSNREQELIQNLEKYLTARATKDNTHWLYMTDTVRTWFDKKEGGGRIQLKGKPSSGPWTDWDNEMHGYSVYDSLMADTKTNSVSGIFVEHNDFFNLIGKKEGTKSRRTYWLNEKGLVKEVLFSWLPENISTDKYLEPIVKWAMKNDSSEIAYLYNDNNIIPSTENAKRWKDLLRLYNESEGN